MGSRRKSRELALQMLFQHDVTAAPPEQMFADFDDLKKAAASTREYACWLVAGAIRDRAHLDDLISRQAENWRLERMPIVDRSLLRIAIWEMLNSTEAPPAVVIDEALEIAKRFSTPKSAQFVNGILDAVRRAEGLGAAVSAGGSR